jgi:NDP-sugar pyrophosphorylase family protein
MKAMVLAAGLGTRLRPLTNNRPKALVEVAGRTMLDITLSRLRAFGVQEVIINAHHFADLILKYLETNDNFGMRIEVSCEQSLLDTGGGLKKAAHFFLEDSDGSDKPFLVHNVDVLSTIDLRKMIEFHTENGALATLAVQDRQTSRYLLFDEKLQLCGRMLLKDLKNESARSSRPAQALAFCGIHVLSPRLFRVMTEQGAFSIITSYLRLATQGERILAFRADQSYWRDLGRPEDLLQASEDAKQKVSL